MPDATPSAADKLRTVLDYLPCEACLATPSPDQELLCSLCRRLDREVAIKLVTRTTVLVQRPEPEPAAAPVVIAPAAAEPEPVRAPAVAPPPAPREPDAPLPVEVVLKRRVPSFERRAGDAIEIVVEPYDDPALAAAAAAAAPAAAEPEAQAAPEEPAPAEAPRRFGFLSRRKAEPEPAAEEAPAETPAEAPAAVEPTEPAAAEAPPAEAPPAEAKPKRSLFGFRRKKAEPEPAPPQEEEEEEDAWTQLATYDRDALDAYKAEEEAATLDDVFTYERPEPEPTTTAPEPEPEPEPVAAAPEAEPVVEDDYVFRPPADDEPAYAEPPRAIEDDQWLPDEEIPLEPPAGQRSPWAPPEEDDNAWAPPAEPEPADAEALPAEAEPEEEAVFDMEVIDDDAPPAEEEEIVEMELVEDDLDGPTGATTAEPAETPAATGPTPEGQDDSDLWRLTDMTPEARQALQTLGINTLSHLSGHDPVELADRTGLRSAQLRPWIHTADLTHEAGIPTQHAQTLVQNGIHGTRDLADADLDTLLQRLHQNGHHQITERELRRWQRRT